ncbi:TrkA family potassium uptake protein [Imperialibacter roseus]|uniref:TrkA family potassium uptake protein n=1 Tax=Imperialibacter roseus TaxID=1324217 RepID=A0ABZ0IJ81_9BACT|nr:TrkA family potassium uptake protein [Imperialibacter roseus]WOK04214.1 TrkA family potassium uptake protein [Imperialibacter roseus]
MKYIVFGLGNFGSSLSTTLTAMGHEVIGVDKRMEKVELHKDDITHTICLDSTDIQAVSSLPIGDADTVIVAIGEDEGASIMTTALLKQLHARRIIGRAVSELQTTVMQAMGIHEISRPEQTSAVRLAKRLNFKGVVDSFELSNKHNIIELKCPPKYEGKTLKEVEFRKKYNITVLTTIKEVKGKDEGKISGVATADTLLEQGDTLVIFGSLNDLRDMLDDSE